MRLRGREDFQRDLRRYAMQRQRTGQPLQSCGVPIARPIVPFTTTSLTGYA